MTITITPPSGRIIRKQEVGEERRELEVVEEIEIGGIIIHTSMVNHGWG